jgi:hypothetical protein
MLLIIEFNSAISLEAFNNYYLYPISDVHDQCVIVPDDDCYGQMITALRQIGWFSQLNTLDYIISPNQHGSKFQVQIVL